MTEASNPNPDTLEDWYSHLLDPALGVELTPDQQAKALEVVGVAMDGIRRLLEAGQISGVQVSFGITDPNDPGIPDIEFNFST